MSHNLIENVTNLLKDLNQFAPSQDNTVPREDLTTKNIKEELKQKIEKIQSYNLQGDFRKLLNDIKNAVEKIQDYTPLSNANNILEGVCSVFESSFHPGAYRGLVNGGIFSNRQPVSEQNPVVDFNFNGA